MVMYYYIKHCFTKTCPSPFINIIEIMNSIFLSYCQITFQMYKQGIYAGDIHFEGLYARSVKFKGIIERNKKSKSNEGT